MRPGSGKGQCGAGIPSRAQLSFSFLYSTGTQEIDEEVASLQSSFRQAGIKLLPDGGPFSTVAGEPEMDSQISAVTSTLGGVLPLDPVGNIYPENWYFVK